MRVCVGVGLRCAEIRSDGAAPEAEAEAEADSAAELEERWTIQLRWSGLGLSGSLAILARVSLLFSRDWEAPFRLEGMDRSVWVGVRWVLA